MLIVASNSKYSTYYSNKLFSYNFNVIVTDNIDNFKLRNIPNKNNNITLPIIIDEKNNGELKQVSFVPFPSIDNVFKKTFLVTLSNNLYIKEIESSNNTNVSSTNVSSANVRSTNVQSTNVQSTNVSSTNVSSTNVQSTNVSSTNVSSANKYGLEHSLLYDLLDSNITIICSYLNELSNIIRSDSNISSIVNSKGSLFHVKEVKIDPLNIYKSDSDDTNLIERNYFDKDIVRYLKNNVSLATYINIEIINTNIVNVVNNIIEPIDNIDCGTIDVLYCCPNTNYIDIRKCSNSVLIKLNENSINTNAKIISRNNQTIKIYLDSIKLTDIISTTDIYHNGVPYEINIKKCTKYQSVKYKKILNVKNYRRSLFQISINSYSSRLITYNNVQLILVNSNINDNRFRNVINLSNTIFVDSNAIITNTDIATDKDNMDKILQMCKKSKFYSITLNLDNFKNCTFNIFIPLAIQFILAKHASTFNGKILINGSNISKVDTDDISKFDIYNNNKYSTKINNSLISTTDTLIIDDENYIDDYLFINNCKINCLIILKNLNSLKILNSKINELNIKCKIKDKVTIENNIIGFGKNLIECDNTEVIFINNKFINKDKLNISGSISNLNLSISSMSKVDTESIIDLVDNVCNLGTITLNNIYLHELNVSRLSSANLTKCFIGYLITGACNINYKDTQYYEKIDYYR